MIGWHRVEPVLTYAFREASMNPSVDEIVRQHVEASKRFRRSIRGNPAKARAFLIKAGILSKDGKRLAKRFR